VDCWSLGRVGHSGFTQECPRAIIFFLVKILSRIASMGLLEAKMEKFGLLKKWMASKSLWPEATRNLA